MTTVDVPTYPDENAPGYIRPGFATSEFWLAVLGNAVALITFWKPQLGEHLGTWVQPLAAAGAMVGNLAYAFSRAIVKKAAHDAVATQVAARAAGGAHQGDPVGLADLTNSTQWGGAATVTEDPATPPDATTLS